MCIHIRYLTAVIEKTFDATEEIRESVKLLTSTAAETNQSEAMRTFPLREVDAVLEWPDRDPELKLFYIRYL